MRPTSCRLLWGLQSFCAGTSSSASGAPGWLRFCTLTPAAVGRRLPVQLAKTFSSYIARQFFVWFSGVFLAMVIITFLLDYIELIRRSGTRIQATLWVLLEMAALNLPRTAHVVLPF